MRILMGAQMFNKSDNSTGHKVVIRKNAEKVFDSEAAIAFPSDDGKTIDGKNHFPADAPATYKWVDMTNGTRGTQADFATKVTQPEAGKTVRVRFFWEEEAKEEGVASELVISPNKFPGTYRVVGDALIRSRSTGADEAFQFVINKAKMLSEVTLTMQAEGK